MGVTMSKQELAYTAAALAAVACAAVAAAFTWVLLNPAVFSGTLAASEVPVSMARLAVRLVTVLAGWLVSRG
jgi:hypothetical protein